MKKKTFRAVTDENGCWVWQHRTEKGYARRKRHGRNVRVHRDVYERQVGPIPEGQVLHHQCGNKACVNPEHMSVRDTAAHTRLHSTGRYSGADNPRAKITTNDVREIRAARADGASYITLAARYNIHRTEVSRIARRTRWAHITQESR